MHDVTCRTRRLELLAAYAQAPTSILPSFTLTSTSSFLSQIIQNGALSLLVLCTYGPSTFWQSIMDHNGGSVVAMAGKDCVAIASDLRLGAGAMTVALNFEKVSYGSPSSHDNSKNVCAHGRRSFL